MTIAPEQRPLLSLEPTPGHARGKRSPVTCRLKCADQCAHPAPNASANEYFRDIASRALSRRTMLGGLAAAAAVVVGSQVAGAPSAAALPATPGKGNGKGLAFGPIVPQPAATDAFVVPDGYEWSPIIRWGDPILPGARAFDPAAQSPQQQALQFGYNCDYLDILPADPKELQKPVHTRSRGTRGLLVSNHEYTNPGIMFDESYDAATRRAIERAAHGMSVVEVTRRTTGSPWTYSRISPLNRRIHMDTEFVVDGPAAGTDLMKTVADPTGRRVKGTLNNCAGGTTPWGTVVSGEENFHGYLRVKGSDPRDARYGLRDAATGYGWENDDPRFDGNNPGYENESHRFGWIVEIDPYDPNAAPVKHTALGRFKHEGANIILSKSGHAVAYMGDDEAFDYVYKFVSKNRFQNGSSAKARAHNKTLLSEGDLYVARFEGDSPAAEIDGSGALPSDGAFDGRGRWIPLVKGGRSMVEGMSVEEVLVFTRLAADKVGATKMDRPEDVEPNPVTGKIYVACTNNSSRGNGSGRDEGPTEPNPRNANRDGHVVEIAEDRGDQLAETFTWNLLIVAGDPSVNGSAYFSGFPADKVSPISCPDNVAFDAEGNLWISTDGQPSSIQKCDGLFKVPLTGRERGNVQQFLSVPREAETCGPVVDSVDGMVYVNVQHPGENGSWAQQRSFFPDYVEEGEQAPAGAWRGPRPATVQVYKAGAGEHPGKPGKGKPGHGWAGPGPFPWPRGFKGWGPGHRNLGRWGW
ncbi:phosphatase [Xylanimonas oleitrophica]|uniref:Phosphatase n=1 Tax=Xylanimonas oleitrophica TaxID=2607479 RepID=A0A2W5WKA9_9MICO|nr:PhoX family phosphatase [Xylanimonas oleitrophica]PZR52019.1 phosphatase [Xylanimonas oleitrophica]